VLLRNHGERLHDARLIHFGVIQEFQLWPINHKAIRPMGRRRVQKIPPRLLPSRARRRARLRMPPAQVLRPAIRAIPVERGRAVKSDSVYLSIGYSDSNGSVSGLTGSASARSKALVRLPPSAYVDAILVEVVPAPAPRHDSDVARAQAGIRLYETIFNYRESPPSRLCIWA
jgi:hypothetical protein